MQEGGWGTRGAGDAREGEGGWWVGFRRGVVRGAGGEGARWGGVEWVLRCV